MNSKEKIQKEKLLDSKWNEIKKHRETLTDILTIKKRLAEDDPLETILLYQCVILAIHYMEIHEEDFTFDKKINFNEDFDVFIKTMLEGISEALTVEDKSKPVQERLKSLNAIRETSWKILYSNYDDIKKMYSNMPNIETADDAMLVLRCAYAVLMEIGIKDTELAILEEMYNQ